jgi:hypothetical protein
MTGMGVGRQVSMAVAIGIVAVATLIAAGAVGPALAAGRSSDLQLAIDEPVDGARVVNGDVRRVNLTLTNSGAAAAGPIGLVVEIIGGTIEAPGGDGISWRRRVGRWRGRIARLPAGGAMKVALDIHFTPVPIGASTHLAGGGIVVTARVHGDDESIGPVAGDDWVMANCGAVFHGALQGIAVGEAATLREAVASAQEGWRNLNGRWVFDPGRVRGDEDFARVVTAARRLVQARGVDGWLREALKKRTPSRVLADLRAYLGQRRTAAICTGAPQYMAFLETGLVDFRDRVVTAERLFESAGQQADWKLLDAEAALAAAASSDDEAEGQDSNGSLAALRRAVREARMLWLAVLDDDGTTGRLLDNVNALRALAGSLSELSIGRGSSFADVLAQIKTALGALEAFAYIQNAHAHHHTVSRLYDATVDAVHSAHARECTC